jgi:uncharacterized repeat protein (TIGR01451 family)
MNKSAAANQVDSGGTILYTWAVTNNGPDDAANVVMVDVLPADITFAGFTGISQGTGVYDSGPHTITASFGTVTSGTTAIITAMLTITAPEGSIVTNTANVSSDTTDPNPSDNTDSHSVIVGDAGTVVIQLDFDPEPFRFSIDFTSTIPGCESFTLDDVANAALPNSISCIAPVGSYEVTQESVGGYNTKVTCTDPNNNSSTSGVTAEIDLDDGETITCLFKNTAVQVPAPDLNPPNFPKLGGTVVPSTVIPTVTPTQAPATTTAAIQPPSTGNGGIR